MVLRLSVQRGTLKKSSQGENVHQFQKQVQQPWAREPLERRRLVVVRHPSKKMSIDIKAWYTFTKPLSQSHLSWFLLTHVFGFSRHGRKLGRAVGLLNTLMGYTTIHCCLSRHITLTHKHTWKDKLLNDNRHGFSTVPMTKSFDSLFWRHTHSLVYSGKAKILSKTNQNHVFFVLVFFRHAFIYAHDPSH